MLYNNKGNLGNAEVPFESEGEMGSDKLRRDALEAVRKHFMVHYFLRKGRRRLKQPIGVTITATGWIHTFTKPRKGGAIWKISIRISGSRCWR